MINWPIVLAAFCAGLTLTCLLAARGSSGTPSSPSSRWLLSSLALISTCLAIGLIASAAFQSLTTPTPLPGSFITWSSPSSVAQSGPPSSVSTSPTPPSFFLLPSSSPTPASTDTPPRLQIPSLNIDEPVQTIPIHDGEWDLTALGTEIGWLTTTGARPGDAWAMVFIGHITVSAKEHGAFAYLQKIQKDAEVIYQFAGNSYVYRVENISRAGPTEVNRLYLADGKSLLLITCTDWDETQRVYASRLVVQARLKQ